MYSNPLLQCFRGGESRFFFSLNKITQKHWEKALSVIRVGELGFPTSEDDVAGDTALLFLSGPLLGIDQGWLESGSWREVDK